MLHAPMTLPVKIPVLMADLVIPEDDRQLAYEIYKELIAICPTKRQVNKFLKTR